MPIGAGSTRRAAKVGAAFLVDAISTAQERANLIMTSDSPLEGRNEILGSERLTGAALDRLAHRCRIVETDHNKSRLAGANARTQRVRLAEAGGLWTAQPAPSRFPTGVLPFSTGARSRFGSAFTLCAS